MCICVCVCVSYVHVQRYASQLEMVLGDDLNDWVMFALCNARAWPGTASSRLDFFLLIHMGHMGLSGSGNVPKKQPPQFGKMVILGSHSRHSPLS